MLLLVVISGRLVANEWVATDSTVAQIANTNVNGRNFSIITLGGSGPCAGKLIIFPESDASGVEAHQRAYATALMALSMGMRVSIYNYYSSSCDRASFIAISN